MIVTVVSVKVKPEWVSEFIRETLENHKNSVMEPGNLRFDVLQNTEKPNEFTLYEAYETEEAAANHKKTAHYLKWREAVADFMAEPRTGIAHSVVAPTGLTGWDKA